MREHFSLFAGLRPVRLWDGVPGPLGDKRFDMLVIREQTEGLFAGRHDPAGNDPNVAQDRMVITRARLRAAVRAGFRPGPRAP